MDRNYVDALIDANSFLPQWLMDVETQAVIIAGLCCVGAWVIFQWMIQIVFSVLWPFVVVAAVMIFIPSWRKALAKEYLPKHVKTIRRLTRRLANSFNNTYSN